MKKSDKLSLLAFGISYLLTIVYVEVTWVKIAIIALDIIGVAYATED